MFEGTDIMKILQNMQLLSATDLYVRVMNTPEAQEKAVKLNTDQLRERFINSDGVLLSDVGGEYSPRTMATGRKKSPSSVDLYDTGEYHESFKIENVTSSGFDIVSDSVKDDGTDLKVEWGEEIEGLTEESQLELAQFIWEVAADLILTSIAA